MKLTCRGRTGETVKEDASISVIGANEVAIAKERLEPLVKGEGGDVPEGGYVVRTVEE